jgi:hypothetical protein
METCFFCKRELGINETRYLVEQATKPKGHNKRWKKIGVACEPCGENNKTRFEYKE